MALMAMARYGDGHTGPANVVWSTDNPAVATVDPRGVLTAMRIGRATISATLDAVSAGLDVSVVPLAGGAWSGDFSGTWTGQSERTKCTWLGGPGPSPCRGLENGGDRRDTRFDVQQNQNSTNAEATIGGISALRGSLAGWVDETAHLYLLGTISNPEAGTAQLTDADFTISATGNLIGTYSWTRTFQNAFGAQKVHEDFKLLALTRAR
jgi:hypothetical protein